MKKEPKTPNAYLKACKLLGEKPRPELKDKSNKRNVANDAHHRLMVCIAAKNLIKQDDGTLKEWEQNIDGTKIGYEPRFYKGSSPGFSYYNYGIWASSTGVGARLQYSSYELMKEGVVEFNEYYQALLN